MATNSTSGSLTQPGQALNGVDHQRIMYSTLLIVILSIIVAFNWSKTYSEEVPIANPGKSFLWSKYKAKYAFLVHSKTLLASARALYPKQPFRIMTDVGEQLLMPPEFSDELADHPDLSFNGPLYEDWHVGIPGFDVVSNTNHTVSKSVVKKQMTKSLATTTGPMSKEAALALSINFGACGDWQETIVKNCVLDIVARISSRVFLGAELCRNEDWLRITKEYTVNLFMAAAELRVFPRFSRKVVHWFLPKCRRLRAQIVEAQRVITTMIEERRRTKEVLCAAGRPAPLYNDATEWIEHEAEIRGMICDETQVQLGLSVAAIPTTSNLFTQVMLDLAQHPEIIDPLRKEIVQSLRGGGWKKTSLSNMKLLDSVIKESQRMKPSQLTTMLRRVERDVTLSNGFHLKKGTRIQVDMCRMWDPAVHKDPDQWDGYRFLKLQEIEGKGHLAQLVSTSADHLGFGLGRHACPGRFFAANEIKIAVCHLLMKYDWKLAQGTNVEPKTWGRSAIASPTAKILIRHRDKMELDIDSI